MIRDASRWAAMKPAGCGRIPPQRLKAATYDRQAPQASPPKQAILALSLGITKVHTCFTDYGVLYVKYPTTYEKLLLHVIVAICLVAWRDPILGEPITIVSARVTDLGGVLVQSNAVLRPSSLQISISASISISISEDFTHIRHVGVRRLLISS